YAVLFFPGLSLASEKWSLDEAINNISARGDCSGRQVRIDLFFGVDKTPIYTSGATCIGGKFNFSDNLLQWESLKDGEYRLVVNEKKEEAKKVKIERPIVVVTPVAVKIGSENEGVVSTENDIVKEGVTFLGAFTAMQQAILDMRVQLEATDYPEMAKISLGAVLDSLDVAAGKLANLIFSSAELIEDNKMITPSEEKVASNENSQEDGKKDEAISPPIADNIPPIGDGLNNTQEEIASENGVISVDSDAKSANGQNITEDGLPAHDILP
ncbi:MAG: hypothetical protein WC823_02220, partial [Parcubacteria group bacterium]